MKKIKKLVFFFALFFSISLVTNQKVLADSGIYSIDVKADIQDDGSVIITDERKYGQIQELNTLFLLEI